MPGLWKHKMRPISFTLLVDDFGVKYVGEEQVIHLIWCKNKNINSLRIGPENFIAVSSSIGIMMLEPLTYLCRGTLQSSCKNTSITCRQNRSIVHTPLPQSSMEPRLKPLSPSTSHKNVPRMKLRKSNVSLGAFYTMPMQLTLQY